MTSKGHVKFNKIFIIESLTKGETKSGHMLSEELNDACDYYLQGLSYAYWSVSSKSEFISYLKRIAKETSDYGVYPILQIEVHGNVNGIELNSGEFLTWDDLRPYFQEINKLSCNNLLVVLAACEGRSMVWTYSITEAAPMWGVIGPSGKPDGLSIANSMKEFYRELLTSLNLSKALSKLNPQGHSIDNGYSFVDCKLFFIKGFQKYNDDNYSGLIPGIRIERLSQSSIACDRGNKKVAVRRKKAIKKAIEQDRYKHFRKLRDRFFIIESCPENLRRFEVTFKEALKKDNC